MVLWLFILGACFGSFLGVIAYRLPRKLPIGLSYSRCDGCGQRIGWFDNIPILSYIILKGRCRRCGARIPPRYLIIELLSAFIFLFTYYRFGLTVKTLAFLIFFLLLIALSLIDLETKRIPDVITLPGIAVGFVLSFWTILLLKSVIGIAVGIGVLYLLAVLGKLILKQDAMGGGDIKLLGMIGAFLGPIGVLLTLFFGALVGALISVPLRKRKVPFGPFLSAGAFITAFWGDWVVRMVLRG